MFLVDEWFHKIRVSKVLVFLVHAMHMHLSVHVSIYHYMRDICMIYYIVLYRMSATAPCTMSLKELKDVFLTAAAG